LRSSLIIRLNVSASAGPLLSHGVNSMTGGLRPGMGTLGSGRLSGLTILAMASVYRSRRARSACGLIFAQLWRASVAVQHQHAEFGVGSEFRDPDGIAAEDPLGIFRRMRPAPEPHDLGRRSYGCGEFLEIRVGADDDEVICLGEFPDIAVRAREQAELGHMRRPRV
jgi:hypothetical protein